MAGRAHLSAAQVGDSFVAQYYCTLVEEPHKAHRFYLPGSVVVHKDGPASDFGVTVSHIHAMIMSLNITNIEIKTFESVHSMGGGILLVASGVVKLKRFRSKRSFSQTFFLATQEDGFFVLNDILLFLEEHPIPQSFATSTLHSDSLYMLDPATHLLRGMRRYDYLSIANPQEEEVHDDSSSSDVQNLSLLLNEVLSLDDIEDRQPSPTKSYASIVTDGDAGTSLVANSLPVVSSGHSAAPPIALPIAKELNISENIAPKASRREAVKDNSVAGNEGQATSVYVGNLPYRVSTNALRAKFSMCGKIKRDGIHIRTHKDSGTGYAFVDFEDSVGVQNALKASPIPFDGGLIYVETRRGNPVSSRGKGQTKEGEMNPRSRRLASSPMHLSSRRYSASSSSLARIQEEYNDGWTVVTTKGSSRQEKVPTWRQAGMNPHN